MYYIFSKINNQHAGLSFTTEKNKTIQHHPTIKWCNCIIKTCHDIVEILLKVALNTNQSINQSIQSNLPMWSPLLSSHLYLDLLSKISYELNFF